ncbi:HGxxPAAW family protein [Rarobacter incanus]|uniref:Uncharacterized protein n=1 Tax=Rarobacter incanus TaxID=153494 RepID=A0A542SLY3_9MICO|nr:HGxxPAAW family protein [Rarobacter incanus]TQK75640.1 hypothetical protein FB389_0271 [Rarobacter incanus]
MSQDSHKAVSTQDRFAIEQPFELPDDQPNHNEGRTLAAWFAMLGIVLGAIVATLGVCLGQYVIIAVGAAVVVAALLGGYFLRLAGQGQPR